jgi:hypothetical protein
MDMVTITRKQYDAAIAKAKADALRAAAKPTITYCDRHNPNGIGRIEADCDWCAALGIDQEWVNRLRDRADEIEATR